MPDHPPCHVPGTKPNACASALFAWTTAGTGPLFGPWTGWRLAGRLLIGPGGERISPERLRGLVWTQETRQALDAAQAKRKADPLVRVVVVRLSEFRSLPTNAA